MVRATLLQLLRSSKKQFTTTSYLAGFPTTSSRVVRWEEQQRRWASQTSEKEKKETVPVVVYHCPHPSRTENLKRASLTWCVSGLLTPVVITTLMELPLLDIELMLSASSVILFGIFCNKAVNTCVYKILWRPGSDSFDVVKTTPWLGAEPPSTNSTSPKTVLFSHVRVAFMFEGICRLGITTTKRIWLKPSTGLLTRLSSKGSLQHLVRFNS